ncbi:MAG: TrkA C-terminal domain-containing protein [Verrucomicrobiota bacterium]
MIAAVSPREATRRDIERYLTSERFHVVKRLGAGEVLETRVEASSKVVGKPVGEVKWPPGVVLVGCLRGLHAEVPGPGDVLEAGDVLYAMVGRKQRKAFVKLLS